MATWRVLYRVLGTCFCYPFTRFAHFKLVPATFPGTLGHHPVRSPPLPCLPLRLEVSGCFTQIVAALGELSFCYAAPSAFHTLNPTPWILHPTPCTPLSEPCIPHSVYCFWYFGSFLVIRFVSFWFHFPISTVHCPPSSMSPSISLSLSRSHILLRILCRILCLIICAFSIPVRQ